METVAVFAEHPIKTYGVRAQEGFLLLDLVCPGDHLADCLARLNPGPGLGRTFMISTCRQGVDWRLSALIVPGGADELLLNLQNAGMNPSPPPRPAALVHLQGPHFGDRYGICAAALKGLKAGGIVPLLMEASVHSLFIVLDPEDVPAALDGLLQQFCAPE